MISLFRKRKERVAPLEELEPLQVDMHSHVLPGLDDGSQSIEESLELLGELTKMGYKKLVMTPHIMGDFYRNTLEGIQEKLDFLRQEATKVGFTIDLEMAAEYYLDESFMARLKSGEDLLCFGDKRYVLFETSYMNSFPQLQTVIFELQASGYTPVLAHPERYVYWFERPKEILELLERGVLLQININSLTGYYSRPSKKIAEMLINEKAIRFLGTDCHGIKHINALKKARSLEYYRKALSLDLLNNSLVSA
ncbi:MAG: CpsB/CapC family capsule biosynthesis tyrosine phosphatase [Bacteroidota bacterium]